MTKIDFTWRITARKEKYGKESVGFKTISQIYILSIKVFSQNIVKDERKKKKGLGTPLKFFELNLMKLLFHESLFKR